MYFCTICGIHYINQRKHNPKFDKPTPCKDIKGVKYCPICHIPIEYWDKHLASVSHNIKRHIQEFHKPLQELGDKKNVNCNLCNLKIKDYYKHTFSDIHRFNKDLESIIFYHDIEDFIIHFNLIKNEKDIEDILKLNEEHPFWITAKEELDEEQYKKLKGEIIGRKRNTRIRKKRP